MGHHRCDRSLNCECFTDVPSRMSTKIWKIKDLGDLNRYIIGNRRFLASNGGQTHSNCRQTGDVSHTATESIPEN